jgi:hypothetical protein
MAVVWRKSGGCRTMQCMRVWPHADIFSMCAARIANSKCPLSRTTLRRSFSAIGVIFLISSGGMYTAVWVVIITYCSGFRSLIPPSLAVEPVPGPKQVLSLPSLPRRWPAAWAMASSAAHELFRGTTYRCHTCTGEGNQKGELNDAEYCNFVNIQF